MIPHTGQILKTWFHVQADKEDKTASEAKEAAEETRLDKAVKTLLSLQLSKTQESGIGT